jgi:hypothetical protein
MNSTIGLSGSTPAGSAQDLESSLSVEQKPFPISRHTPRTWPWAEVYGVLVGR